MPFRGNINSPEKVYNTVESSTFFDKLEDSLSTFFPWFMIFEKSFIYSILGNDAWHVDLPISTRMKVGGVQIIFVVLILWDDITDFCIKSWLPIFSTSIKWTTDVILSQPFIKEQLSQLNQ